MKNNQKEENLEKLLYGIEPDQQLSNQDFKKTEELLSAFTSASPQKSDHDVWGIMAIIASYIVLNMHITGLTFKGLGLSYGPDNKIFWETTLGFGIANIASGFGTWHLIKKASNERKKIKEKNKEKKLFGWIGRTIVASPLLYSLTVCSVPIISKVLDKSRNVPERHVSYINTGWSGSSVPSFSSPCSSYHETAVDVLYAIDTDSGISRHDRSFSLANGVFANNEYLCEEAGQRVVLRPRFTSWNFDCGWRCTSIDALDDLKKKVRDSYAEFVIGITKKNFPNILGRNAGKYSIVSHNAHNYDSLSTAKTIAHEIAHGMGAEHMADERCIMHSKEMRPEDSGWCRADMRTIVSYLQNR